MYKITSKSGNKKFLFLLNCKVFEPLPVNYRKSKVLAKSLDTPYEKFYFYIIRLVENTHTKYCTLHHIEHFKSYGVINIFKLYGNH